MEQAGVLGAQGPPLQPAFCLEAIAFAIVELQTLFHFFALFENRTRSISAEQGWNKVEQGMFLGTPSPPARPTFCFMAIGALVVEIQRDQYIYSVR